MKKLFIVMCLLFPLSVMGGTYSSQRGVPQACELYANEVSIITMYRNSGFPYDALLEQINNTKAAPSVINRTLDALNFSYTHQFETSHHAYLIALSLCLAPKSSPSPMHDNLLEYRTFKEAT